VSTLRISFDAFHSLALGRGMKEIPKTDEAKRWVLRLHLA